MTPDGHCETLDELCDYIAEHAHQIYVRARRAPDGRFESLALTEVPVAAALTFAMGWVKRDITPVRLRDLAPDAGALPAGDMPVGGARADVDVDPAPGVVPDAPDEG